MTNYNTITELATTLLAQAAKYADKPTKAESKRLRATINDIQKVTVAAKRDLVAADSAQ
jgi:hypothetical protein